MLGTWPSTLAAVAYFAYAVAFVAVTLYAYFTGDSRVSVPFALVAGLLAAVCAALGFAMLKAQRGDRSWLVWVGGAAGGLGGLGLTLFSVGSISVALFLSPLIFGFLGLPKGRSDG
jgi:hypothetical protein